jgi:hypothetical protein
MKLRDMWSTRSNLRSVRAIDLADSNREKLIRIAFQPQKTSYRENAGKKGKKRCA